MVEQHLAPGDLHDQVLCDQRHVAGVKVFTQLVTGETESRVSDSNDVPLGKCGGGNPLAIDKCSVVTAQVGNLVPAAT